jgi:hypothetical protein
MQTICANTLMYAKSVFVYYVSKKHAKEYTCLMDASRILSLYPSMSYIVTLWFSSPTVIIFNIILV